MAEVAGVSLDEVLRVAELSNLDLTADEVPRMQHDLNAILGHIAQLNELDTTGVPAMAQVGRCWAQRLSRPAHNCARMPSVRRWTARR